MTNLEETTEALHLTVSKRKLTMTTESSMVKLLNLKVFSLLTTLFQLKTPGSTRFTHNSLLGNQWNLKRMTKQVVLKQ